MSLQDSVFRTNHCNGNSSRFILAYATPEDVEQEKISPTVPSKEIQKDSFILKEEVKAKIRQIEREL